MKKILPIIVIGILVLSGLGAVGSTNQNSLNEISLESQTVQLDVSPLSINEAEENFAEVNLENIDTYLMEPGKPILPKIVHTFELPFGVENVNVEVTSKGVVEKSISKEIRPAPMMLPIISAQKTSYPTIEKDLKTYSSNEPYPDKDYTLSVRSGLNKDNQRVTFAIVHLYPVKYIPNEGKLLVEEGIKIDLTYGKSDKIIKSVDKEYDLVIIAPCKFKTQLERLVDHKNDLGVETFLETTEEIYKNYRGFDKPEQIKYFIKDAIETNNIKYVLLVGGLKSQIFAKPRDDCNQGSRWWYVPVRYTNLYDNPKYPLDDEDVLHDPGVISDLYFADIYDGTGDFSSWDPNEDGVYAAWNKPGVEENDEDIDMKPDVYVGRLACRSISEVKTVVDKIINYESKPLGDWFNNMTVISGDGFLDQQDWNIQWDTTNEKGYYTIYAQSENSDGEKGPVDTIPIKIDRRKETELTFNHDDYLIPDLQNGYPAPPIAKIVSVSPGDILGNTDYTYTPNEKEAFCNDFNPWANMSYVNGVLTIRGKSYDPRPYGNITHLHVWIKDINGEIVFEVFKDNLEMYYEGEWTTGEKALKGRGGALYYMDGFENEKIWTSNGKFVGPDDVITAISKGCGFMFMSGHGSPNSWGDHFPGVPGNRAEGSVTGLTVTNIRPWPPFVSFPLYPIDSLSNGEKLPVAVIGGCHNSQFNVSMILGLYDLLPYLFDFLPEKAMWCHGVPVPECFSWRLVRAKNGGAIASMGNTGLGYGMPGKDLTTGGGDGWITIEFFYQYGHEDMHILGQTYSQAINHYIQTFDMTDLESGHPKTVQQWILLGDPSLKIGGYP